VFPSRNIQFEMVAYASFGISALALGFVPVFNFTSQRSSIFLLLLPYDPDSIKCLATAM